MTLAEHAPPRYTQVPGKSAEQRGARPSFARPLAAAALLGAALLCAGVWLASDFAAAGGARRKARRRPVSESDVVALYKEKLHFLKIQAGDCAQHGMVPIKDEASCRVAGTSMGLTNLQVFRTSLLPAEEEFCYYFQKDASIPATLWMGPQALLAGKFQLLCMSRDSAVATHSAALARLPEILDAGAPMTWVGCFKSSLRSDSEGGGGGAPAARLQASGSGTQRCEDVCLKKGYSVMSMQDSGACACLTGVPESHSVLPDFSCGRVCGGEASLSPVRYCGGDGTQAVFRIKASSAPRESSWSAGAQESVLKGISYAPVPLKSTRGVAGGKPWPNDDFMSMNTSALWGPQGRHDLKIIRLLGANAVRLYGNDPSLDHKAFLDEAMAQELHVIAGISDYPYLQMQGSCKSTGWNCYGQVKEAYKLNLLRGFLRQPQKAYHPALRTVILMNEPDLKLLPAMSPANFLKALVSALDAVLDAEKEVGVVGRAPNFTATFSFGVCSQCGQYGVRPGLGQMVMLREAMRNPHTVGYTANNDLWRAYRARFEHSVNTANTADSFKSLFLDAYTEVMHGTPVFVGEYHSPMVKNEQKDLYDVIRLAQDSSNLLTGVSFFEYQVRYDKGGEEMTFGMFGLGGRSLARLSVGGGQYDAWCLMPNLPPQRVEKCGKMEHNVKYVVDSPWSYSLPEPVKSPELCCSRCLETPNCRSWTWEANPDPPATGGCTPARCWLFGGEPVRKEMSYDHGTISGLPPAGDFGKEATGKSQALLSELLIPTHVAKAFGGPGVDYRTLCPVSAVTLMHLTPQQTSCYA